MTPELTQLAELVGRETGIKLDGSRHGLLQAAAARIAAGMSTPALLRALGQPDSGPQLLRGLIDEVTVNETFFFRQADELRALDWRALSELARARGSSHVRVWVAGCASGEEAYTLAMLASESFAPAPAPVSILATDISCSILALAERGRYRARATRGVTPELRQRYFAVDGDQLVAGGQMRQMVSFSRHNLTRDPLPPGAPFELITCRNTLIYFEGDSVRRVVESFQRALAPDGTLILGAADRITTSPQPLSSIRADVLPVDRRSSPRRPARPTAEPVSRRRVAPSAAPPVPASRPAGLAALQAAADAGRLQEAIELASALLAENPLDADAYFIRGLAELGSGDPRAAVESLRAAVYARPDFGLAAFKLGRALELCGQASGAVQAYRQALHALHKAEQASADDRVGMNDIAAACHLRLRALAEPRLAIAGSVR
jgi:chemotaxis protein methyltransferase CheR